MTCGPGVQNSWALIFQASSFSFCETSSGPRGRQLALLKMSLQGKVLSRSSSALIRVQANVIMTFEYKQCSSAPVRLMAHSHLLSIL